MRPELDKDGETIIEGHCVTGDYQDVVKRLLFLFKETETYEHGREGPR
jgi:hypothetical protein